MLTATIVRLFHFLISDGSAGSCSATLPPGAEIPEVGDNGFWHEPGAWIGTGLLLMAVRFYFKRKKANAAGKKRSHEQ